MKKLFVFFIVAGMVIACGSSALAYTTYELTATVKDDIWNGDTRYSDFFSDFSLIYNDNGGGLFSLDELVSFSGMTVHNDPKNNPANTSFYPELYLVPVISGLTNGSGIYWGFRNSSGQSAFPENYWTYQKAVVPIPPSVWLLGSGLIGLVGLRRKFTNYLKR